jgi:hypothetical protein
LTGPAYVALGLGCYNSGNPVERAMETAFDGAAAMDEIRRLFILAVGSAAPAKVVALALRRGLREMHGS